MSISTPRFTHINESFECTNCSFEVPQASSTCRDHCPRCLHSIHVDKNPGDRDAQCGGILKPIGYSLHKKKGTMILFTCQKCGTQKVNRFLERDDYCSDDYDALLKLTAK